MLLLGLYTLDEGEIYYDDRALSQMDYRTLRNQFGVVLQEPSLFSGSIRRNIAANDPRLSLDEIIYAAELAVIHEEIASLPMAYETVIAEGGIDLAGGQRQRLAIARALAHRPALLILDEATSDLDAITESIVDRNLSNLACTRIVIAHRLSTVRNADLILVLDEGFVVERGTAGPRWNLCRTSPRSGDAIRSRRYRVASFSNGFVASVGRVYYVKRQDYPCLERSGISRWPQ
jgi:ABC-type bacteriocin/lantibiotic exporter with double-glycine peptidase domain